MNTAEQLAKALHETFMKLVPEQERFPWERLSDRDKRLATNTMEVLLDLKIIQPGENLNG